MKHTLISESLFKSLRLTIVVENFALLKVLKLTPNLLLNERKPGILAGLLMGSQAGAVDINHAFHLCYNVVLYVDRLSVDLNLISRVSPDTPVSSLRKINS